jgi:predicted SprT family Zn-dependent metalloprotease
MKNKPKQNRCYWCEQFISDKTKIATVKEPKVFYCPKCYAKGLEEEKIAMGYYDKNYSTN